MRYLLPILLLVTQFIVGCSTLPFLDKTVQITSTVLEVPQARSDLESYLSDEELAAIAPELALLDVTYQPIADAVYGNSDVTITDALEVALPTPKHQLLAKSYSSIKEVILERERRTGEPVPTSLVLLSTELEQLWDEWDKVLARNQRAIAYVRLIARLAIPMPIPS